jgi:SAM-dependent methyltransferase
MTPTSSLFGTTSLERTSGSLSPLRAYPRIGIAWERLAEFLGGEFDPGLTDYGTCCTFVEEEFGRLGPDFYRSSVGYLYELTHFHYSPYKDPFFAVLRSCAQAFRLRSIADVGCAVGLDAQALVAAGYEVTLYDFENPSRDYAAWRLKRDTEGRYEVHDLERLGHLRHGLVYAVDVLEHARDPAALAEDLFAAADYVCVNLFEHDRSPWDGRDMHHPLDHWRLLPVFSRRGELLQVAISGETVVTLWRRR